MKPDGGVPESGAREGHLFAPYFPACALPLLSDAPPSLREQTIPAGVMLADIAGFTRLSQQLADYSPGAPEQLREILNRCFGTLVQIIHRHGGDVSHFAGDSVLALWPAANSEGELRSRVLQTIACALRVSQELENVAVTPDFRLQLRLAVSTGRVRLVSVGGVESRWKFLAAGPPLRQIVTGARLVPPGEVAFLPEVRELIGDALLEAARHGFALPVRPATDRYRTSGGTEDMVPSGRDRLLAPYLPRIYRDLIEAGQRDWIGEYRSTTTMFVRVADRDDESPEALDRLQQLVTALQRAIYRYDGSINQLLADEKGTVVVAAWGLSKHAHEDDARRAVKAGLLIRKTLAESGVACAVGIATGRIYVGTRGTAERLDYGLIGDSVNVAARLMESAESVLCDGATRAAARRELLFESLPPLPLRGRSMPVPVFRPLQEKTRQRDGTAEIVGRRQERAQLAAALTALETDRSSRAIAIEGQPGIGKSILARDMIAHTQSSMVRGLVGSGNALERGTPFYAWRTILLRLLGISVGAVADGTESALAERVLVALPETLRPRAGLLEDLLSINMPGHEFVEKMSPSGRADATRALAADLLKRAAEASPLLIVIDDAQWLDSASWGLVDAVRTLESPILLLVVTRQYPDDECPPEYRSLIHDPAALHLRLGPLSREDALTVACNRLQVEEVPVEVAMLIEHKAEGHPLFVEELVSSLVDRELIAIKGGDCVILGDRSRLSSTAISDTVQGIITSRLDQLSPSEQMTLKVASVLGRQFSIADLAAIHPLRPAAAEIVEHLNVMDGLELVRTEPSTGEVSFHHATIEEVAYALLPLAQRRELHAATAERFEHKVAGQTSRGLALLAHHWIQAGATAKALEALDGASEQALRAGAFPEAVLFLRQALDLAQDLKGDVSSTRLARWERQLSRAYFGMGDAEECRRYGESSVARLDRAVPRGALRLAAAIVRELLKSLVRVSSDGTGKAPPDESRRHLTRAFHALSYAYYLDQERASLLHAVLVTVNNAAGDVPSGELARGYAALGYMAGAYGLGKLSGRLQERALRVAEKLDRPLVRADVLYISALSRMSNGQWDALRSDMLTARALFEGLGEIRSLLDVQLLENYVSYNTGDLEAAAAAYADVRTAASRVGAGRNEYLAATWQAGTALRRGSFDECLSAVEKASLLPPERGAELSLLGFWALGSLRMGDSATARRIAEEARSLIATRGYTAPYSFEGYRDVADVYLTLWETPGQGARDTDALKRAALAMSERLRLFSQGCAIAKPSALWIRGRCDALLGRHRRAVRRWSRALDLVVGMNLPFEEAVVRRELARFGRDAAQRRSHLLAAGTLLERIGARYELSRLETP